MPVFGNQNIESDDQSNEGYIIGCKFQMDASPGIADSITIRLYNDVALKFKCAIYNIDDTLLGATEEKVIDSGGARTWETFDFPAPKPSLTPSAWYYLCGWSDTSGVGGNFLRYSASGGNGMVYDVEAYNGWPDPADFAAWGSDRLQSIYCTYTLDLVEPTESVVIKRNIYFGD
jgi:hypothetical protein